MTDPQLHLAALAREVQPLLVAYTECWRAVHTRPCPLPPPVEFAAGQLHLRATLTSDSVLLLVMGMKLWDAEMLARAVVEATYRCAYICAATPDEREARAHELLTVLPDIARLRRHRRAQAALALAPHMAAGPAGARPIEDLVLPDDEVRALEAAYPKPDRARVEGRWGFTRIAETLAAAGAPFNNADALLHQYGMASHSIHVDGDALLIMHEREQRSPQRIDAIELAHGTRLLSDVLSMAALRTMALYHTLGLPAGPLHDVVQRAEALQREFEPSYTAWYAVEYPPRA